MMENKIWEHIIEKSQIKIAIANWKEEDIKMPKKNLAKLVATFVVTIGMTVGVAYAGNRIYEKIWKEPEAYKVNREITEGEKAECITEQQAEEIGNTYLKKIGFKEEMIKELGLTKEFLSQENVWMMNSQKATLKIDGKTGDIKAIQIPTWNYKIPNHYGINREEARKVAKELLERYKPEDMVGEYELVSLKRNSEKDEQAYIWYADFYKKYGDLTNSSEKISIGWIPTINALYSLNIENNSYENNEEKISQEEAIQIAIKKDKTIEENRNIKKIEAKIRIKQMNANVYLRENNKEEYESNTLILEKIGENNYQLKEDATFYKTEKRVRKVWCVVIEYDDAPNSLDSFTYYIDVTTGEIIGGQKGNAFSEEKILHEDINNVIEK